MNKSKRSLIANVLRSDISTGNLAAGSRLPSVRNLAKHFGASPQTTSLALHSLETEKLIEIRPWEGTFVKAGIPGKRVPADPKILPALSKTELVASELTRRISLGKYRVGQPLPLRKTLRFQLGTSPPTLNGALQMVESKGLIHRKGSTFIVGPKEVYAAGRKQIISRLPAWSVPLARKHLERGGSRKFVREFERELYHHNIYFEGKFRRETRGAGKSDHDNIGYYYPCPKHTVSVVTNGKRSLMERELNRLNRLDRPVILVDCNVIQKAFPGFSFRPFKNVYPFGLYGLEVGKYAAGYLCALGHRRIAYFGLDPAEWNLERQRGLEKGLRTWEKGNCRLFPFQLEYKPGNLRSYGRGWPTKVVDDVARFTASAFNGYQIENDDLSRKVATDALDRILMDFHRRELNPAFEEVLRNREITAWVCADSSVGMAASEFLTAKSIKVPDEISLMAFEDGDMMMNYALTGCFYEFERMAYLAVHAILGDIPVRRDRNGVMECPVRVVDRGSVDRI